MSVPRECLELSLQFVDKAHRAQLPRHRVARWLRAALEAPAQITVRVVGTDEGRALNRDYRGKDHATNVLTFDYQREPAQRSACETAQRSRLGLAPGQRSEAPMKLRSEAGPMPRRPCTLAEVPRSGAALHNCIGASVRREPTVVADLVLCAPVIEQEARDEGKTLVAHYAHLLVHGALHAQGYDHQRRRAAARMEARESEVLLALGLPDPYAR
jgi:probable rRNA maturation factor